MENRYVGKRIPRLDAIDKVTGHAIYGIDVELPGMLYGTTLRSPLAHGRIAHLDISEARKAPGVRAVVTGKDLPFRFGAMIQDQPFMAIERVRYVGEPVAAVAADTEYEAQEAMGKIRVEYEELPAVFDAREAAAESAPLIHPNQEEYDRSGGLKYVPGTNICVEYDYSLGDVEAGLEEADEIFEDTFEIHSVAHTPMEPHVAVARYSVERDHYTIWASVDRPYMMAKQMADALGISVNQVRYICHYVGGGFGGKSTLVAEAIAVVLARSTKGRPVKVAFSREEELTASQTRVAAHMKLKTGVKRDGTFTARRAEVFWGCGAYASAAPGVANRGVRTIFGPYRIPNLGLSSKLLYTNRELCGPYRGFGTTQVTWACEVQMDIIAEKLGMDPLDLRLKNGYVEGDTYINGQVLHSVGLRETLEKASREIGWGTVSRGHSETKRRGKGIAAMIKGTLTPTDSYCVIKMNQDGSVTVLAGSPEIGGGQKTVLAQIAAEAIGVPLASISMARPDTYIMPYDTAVASSRTTYHMGNAVKMAGEEVRRKILEAAGDTLGTDPARLDLDEGKIIEEGVGERITLRSFLAKRFGRGGAIMGEGHYNPAGSSLLEALPGREGMSSIFWMFATQAAEVEVDTETGVVKVLKVAAAHDVGRAINPVGCEQQIEGSVVMGVSNTLFEAFKTEKGRILNDSLTDYKLASMLDCPETVSIIVEAVPHREGPFGAKGIGEPAASPTAPAIANAIYDAVGVRIYQLPITPEKVLAALKEKEDGTPTPQDKRRLG